MAAQGNRDTQLSPFEGQILPVAPDLGASLGAAEAGQVGSGSPELSSAKGPEVFPLKSKYAGMLVVGDLQENDQFLQEIRAFPSALGFLQTYTEHELEEIWVKIRECIFNADDAKVPALVKELRNKASEFLELTKGRKLIADLKRPRARDLRLFLKYLGYFGTSRTEYPVSPRVWKALQTPRRFEDWARSIAMNRTSMINRCLRFLVSPHNVTIGGSERPREKVGKLIWLLETGASLSASVLFGAPLVILASEMFVRWVNIVILVVWVVMFQVFLIWREVDSLYSFVFVLAYTTMLANVNVGGQVGDGLMS